MSIFLLFLKIYSVQNMVPYGLLLSKRFCFYFCVNLLYYKIIHFFDNNSNYWINYPFSSDSNSIGQ